MCKFVLFFLAFLSAIGGSPITLFGLINPEDFQCQFQKECNKRQNGIKKSKLKKETIEKIESKMEQMP